MRMSHDLEYALNKSLRDGLLFGSADEPLDAYGKRVVRAILARQDRPPKEFHNTKWRGEGFGTVGDYRVVVRRERNDSRVYVQIIDDTDGVGHGFTPREMPLLIDALQRALASVNPRA